MDWYEFVTLETETVILLLTFWWVVYLQDEVNELKKQIKQNEGSNKSN